MKTVQEEINGVENNKQEAEIKSGLQVRPETIAAPVVDELAGPPHPPEPSGTSFMLEHQNNRRV